MKHAKSGIAVLMALILLFSLAGCGKNSKGEETKTASSSSDVRLPYSREDGVNPFTAQSLLNQPIMPLLYEGLYYVDASYKAQPEIASSSSYFSGELTVTLDGSHKFSDGSYISPADVVYSFQLAKKSTYYASALTMFSSARGSVGNSVTFKVAMYSPYLTADLTFPVVKSGTGGKDVAVPTGSGQYKYRTSDMGGLLEKNDECKTVRTPDEKGTKSHRGSINKIYLSNISDTATLLDSLAIGNFNAAYDDLAAGPPERVKVNYGQMPMNDIVMVKLRTSGDLGNDTLRRDISGLLDREALVNTGLNGYGIPSTLPFNPQWYATKDIKVSGINKDKAENQVRKAFAGKTLSILTDGDNPLKVGLATELQNQLLEIGIRTTIASPGYETYASAAGGDGYDFIIVEYKIPNDMNLAYAMPDKANLKLWYQVLSGQVSLDKYAAWYQKRMPFLTLAYRNGLLAYSKDLVNKPVPLPGNPYADAYQWEVD